MCTGDLISLSHRAGMWEQPLQHVSFADVRLTTYHSNPKTAAPSRCILHHLCLLFSEPSCVFCRRLPDGVRRYFEGKRQYDKAVQLYQKGGDMSRALEICFKAQLFDELRDIGK